MKENINEKRMPSPRGHNKTTTNKEKEINIVKNLKREKRRKESERRKK